MATSTVPAIIMDDSEKNQDCEMPQGNSLPIERPAQAATDPYPEHPKSIGDEETHGQSCQGLPAEDRMVPGRVQVLSRFTTRSSATPTPPPDGGVAAWMCGMYKK